MKAILIGVAIYFVVAFVFSVLVGKGLKRISDMYPVPDEDKPSVPTRENSL